MKKFARFVLLNGTYHKTIGYLEDCDCVPLDAIEISDEEEVALNNGKDFKDLTSRELVDTNTTEKDAYRSVEEIVCSVELIDCPRCGRKQVEAHPVDSHLCRECVISERERTRSAYKVVSRREDWIDVARDCGIDLWVMQPGESQWEYSVWCVYRDSYPGKKPDYRAVARQLNTTYDAVKHVASKWNFALRLQAWMSHVDKVTLEQRHREILDMNKEYVGIAATLRGKLATAVQGLNPAELKPSDIGMLMKTAAEIEKKARLDTLVEDEHISALSGNEEVASGIKKKEAMKSDDMTEIVGILAKAGVLGALGGATVKTTTEVTIKESPIDVTAVEED